MTDIPLGWYHINEVWNLYVDAPDGVDETHRVLEPVRVDYINVDEKPDGDRYRVAHYGPDGSLITSLTLDADDIAPVLRGKEPTERPWHI